MLQNDGDIAPAVISIARKCDDVFKRINSSLSYKRAEAHMEALAKEGKADLFKALNCVYCESAIDLTHLSETPRVFCKYLDQRRGRDY